MQCNQSIIPIYSSYTSLTFWFQNIFSHSLTFGSKISFLLLSRPCGSERIGQLWEVVGRCAAGFLPVAAAGRLRATVTEEG
jgi:hypothetical protein